VTLPSGAGFGPADSGDEEDGPAGARDRLADIGEVVGSAFADVLRGNAEDNRLFGTGWR
jgi:hypothetical protein